MNADDLASLPATSGSERLAEFAREAERHARRLHVGDWDLVLGSWDAFGPLPVGQHTGSALGEWHVHAWDFAQVTGGDHLPADASTVATGRAGLLAAAGESPAGDPWQATLRAAGRMPRR
nr:hypothetical protein [Micromonospora sp. DSM 115978]